MKRFALVIMAVSAIALYTCMTLMASSYPTAETQVEEEYYTDEELAELGIWKEDFTVRVNE